MRIAVVTEFSVSSRCNEVVNTLTALGHDAFALGMPDARHKPTLNYLHTGLIAALALNLGMADFVVGGCGTGQGFAISAMQYPGVYCGLLRDALDAWLFRRINSGNCVSLPLNQGYGWAAEQNLRLLFTQLFDGTAQTGFPAERAELQQTLRRSLRDVSGITHRPFENILHSLPVAITGTVFGNTTFTDRLGTAKPGRLLAFIQSEFYGQEVPS